MTRSSTAAERLATPDHVWLNFPVAGHAVVSITADGTVNSYNEGARLLFDIPAGAERIQAADLFGPPLVTAEGRRSLLDGLAAASEQPPAWTGTLACFRGPGRPFVVTATAVRDLGGAAGEGSLTVICGPPPPRNAALPAAGWLPPDLAPRIGHELRGTMTGIAGLAAILARRAAGASGTGDELRRLGMIEQAARAGIAVVDNVVEISRIESGRIHCTKAAADLQQVIAAAIGMCAAAVGATAEVRDTTVGAVVVRTDPGLVRPILVELITNALVAGSATRVSVRAHALTDTTSIEVTDDGRGIAVEDQPTIFEAFVRGQSAPDTAAGLGLYLARRRAQLIGAEVTMSSSPGHGSTFTLTLPAGSDPEPTATARTGAGGT
ncbi:sensor histidine kinase [Actinoplanes palleronii]|uniref:histidine kinase n=1 Tax=Actinoplanes palleronii TaxID=113570 RepID=A0ABQ4BFP0_9ACTN|nr:HAMP domain-containing sensor histidine kinase [Actinoplanes palleronii]GIE69498.1 hypothetical protein Apa02nite_056060 [Actinoplanes palleronii]